MQRLFGIPMTQLALGMALAVGLASRSSRRWRSATACSCGSGCATWRDGPAARR